MFIQAAGLAYHHRAKCGAYHQAPLGLYIITRQRASYMRLDDIPQQVADSIQGLRLDLSLKARYNKLIDNQEFVEKIATVSCLSTLATRDII